MGVVAASEQGRLEDQETEYEMQNCEANSDETEVPISRWALVRGGSLPRNRSQQEHGGFIALRTSSARGKT